MPSSQSPSKHLLHWRDLYSEAELYKAAVRLYTKPLFDWRKALVCAADGGTLYDFARHGMSRLRQLHSSLVRRQFEFRPALALHRNFNGKHRTLFVQPWEERLVSLLLYRILNVALDPGFSTCAYAYRCRGFGVDRCQQDIAAALRASARPLFIAKRDVSDFFASIDHGLLLDKIREHVAEDDFLNVIVSQCVRFRYVDKGEVRTAERGVPFGTAIACLLANLYLSELDHRLAAVGNIRFFRYADDMLVISTQAEAAAAAARILDGELERLGLRSKPSHEAAFVLADRTGPDAPPAGSGPLPVLHKFRHLGLEFRADGSVGLSRDKFRKVCNLFRYAFRRNRRRFRRIVDWEQRAALAVRIARETVEQGVRNVAIIDYYLRHVTDESQLKQIDRWLAEEVLSLAFGGGHKKGYYRRLSVSRLRGMGLPSLVHRRRLLLHGHIQSSFFVWKVSKKQRGYGGQAARRDRKPVDAFSQSPEAAAESTS